MRVILFFDFIVIFMSVIVNLKNLKWNIDTFKDSVQ